MTKKQQKFRERISLLRKRAIRKFGFPSMIASVVVISLVLVSIALNIYNTSGAAQVDLSRPGFASVQKQAGSDNSNNEDQSFSETGQITKQTISDFKNQYSKHTKRITASTSYSEDALSDTSLQILVDHSADQQSTSASTDNGQ